MENSAPGKGNQVKAAAGWLTSWANNGGGGGLVLAPSPPPPSRQYGTAQPPYRRKDSEDGRNNEKTSMRRRLVTRFAGPNTLARPILLALLLMTGLLLSRQLYHWLLLGSSSSPISLVPTEPNFRSELRLVSIFSRHGDRAPSDSLPHQDRHRDRPLLFWPNGLHNLTQAGKLRAFRMGLETRRHYSRLLDFDSNSILALSSPVERCYQTAEHFLRGLYDLDQPLVDGRRQLAEYRRHCFSSFDSTISTQCPPPGLGSPSEWSAVQIDTTSLPTLTYLKLNNCLYRKMNPSPVDSNLLASDEIKALEGMDKLENLMRVRYERGLTYDALTIFSTVLSELSLVRTAETLNYTDHFADWIDLEVSRRGESVITLLDLLEQVDVLAHRDRIQGPANLIQSGTLLTNLIASQQVALGQEPTAPVSKTLARRFKHKKLILYTSHDTILQRLLFTLGIIRTDSGSFEQRFHRWQSRRHDELGMFLDGFKMSQYGLSIRFELWQHQLLNNEEELPTVRMSIYNRADAKHQPILYEPVQFGSICRRQFLELYPAATESEMERDFYRQGRFQGLDKRLECPFELFRNLTADMMIGELQLRQLCDGL